MEREIAKICLLISILLHNQVGGFGKIENDENVFKMSENVERERKNKEKGEKQEKAKKKRNMKIF